MTKPARRWLAGLLGAACLGAALRAAPPAYEQPPISYSKTQAHDPVSRLLARIAAGQVILRGTDADILRTVLRELDIPVESQVVVFSKTSMQAGLIQPSHPRAIYFSDSAYVGWVPGALAEAAQDVLDHLLFRGAAPLPEPLGGNAAFRRSGILGRLAEVLRGEDPAGRYAYLGAEERRRIVAILDETLPAARPYLHPGA